MTEKPDIESTREDTVEDTQNSGFFELKFQPWGLVTAAGTLLCIATVTGFLGQMWWAFDLTSHFRVQYLILLVVAALALAVGKKRCPALVFVVAAAANLAVITPLYLPRSGNGSMPEESPRFRVMQLNLNVANTNYDAVKRLIAEYTPDLILTEEVNQTWIEQLEAISASYSLSAARPRTDNFGIALLSRLPLEDARVISIGPAGVPSVSASVTVQGKRVAILGTHPLPPGGPEYSRLRNEQLADVADVVGRTSGEIILMGDLNATPWSWPFRRLLRETGLRNSARGWGVQPTWPTFFLPMRIPIDHVLHSAGLRVIRREIGPDIGSDHLPVIVDFVLAAQPQSG